MNARPWPRRPDRRCPRLASLASGSAGRTLACEALTEPYVTHTITRPPNRGNPTLLLSQACLDDASTGPRRDANASEGAPLPLEELGESSLMVDLAQEIPGFAGVLYEPGGDRIVISMTETDRASFPVAREAVSARLAADFSPQSMVTTRPSEFVERIVEYSFIELARHRARLRPHLFAIPEVVGLHVDEEYNRIGVGLEDLSAGAAVLDLAVELAVPVEMISFSEESPIRQLRESSRKRYMPSSGHTLEDVIKIPDAGLRGGYKVKALGGDYCTLGFTAMRAKRPTDSVFVSNSHCSRIPYSTDYAVWGQPDSLDDQHVGYETFDPETRRCSKWRPFFRHDCRESDAALIAVTADSGIALGDIARTTERKDCASDCKIKIDPANPVIRIGSARRTNMVNDELDKVGAKTGWTYGDVKETCKDKRQEGGVYVLCSDMISFKVREGDSGAPVFEYYSDAGTAQLRGVVWGRDEGKDWGAISSLEQIEKNLGRLWAYDPGDPRVDSIAGPKVVPPDHMCRWTARTGGMGPLDHDWSGVVNRNTGIASELWDVATHTGRLILTVTDIMDRTVRTSINVTVNPNVRKPELCWKFGDPPVDTGGAGGIGE